MKSQILNSPKPLPPPPLPPRLAVAGLAVAGGEGTVTTPRPLNDLTPPSSGESSNLATISAANMTPLSSNDSCFQKLYLSFRYVQRLILLEFMVEVVDTMSRLDPLDVGDVISQLLNGAHPRVEKLLFQEVAKLNETVKPPIKDTPKEDKPKVL